MPRKTIKALEEEILILKARNIWIEGINKELLTFLKTTTSYFTEIKVTHKSAALIVENTETICLQTIADIEEALNGRSKGTKN